MRAFGAVLLLALVGAGGWFVYRFLNPENLARRPPQFDALRTAILREVHLEPEIQVKQFGDRVDLNARMNIVFPHVPASANKPEIEKQVRAMVKQYLPAAHEVDVQFGDNLVGPPGKRNPRGNPTDRALEKLYGAEARP
jgi:pantothenate kinase type III